MKKELRAKRLLIGIILIGVIVIMGILGFNKLLKQIDEEKTFTVDTIDEIKINVTTELVLINETDASGNVRVHLKGKGMTQEVKLDVQVIDRILTIGIERDRILPEDTRLEIYLPKDFTKNLAVNITTGVVKIDSANLNSFILTTNSGGMKAEQLSANEISITTASGGIKAAKLEAKKLNIQSKTASVKIDECITESAQIKTTSGSITLRLSDTAEFLYEAKTSTGKLQSDFPVNTKNRQKMTGQVGTKDNKIVLQTSTGAINLLQKG